MSRPLDSQITLRIPSDVRAELDQIARQRATTPVTLARSMLEEATRRALHPGIGFRDGPAGRRACIEGRRLDVWQIMETVWASDGEVDEAAGYLGLRPDQVHAAVAYYADHPAEIDEWVEANRAEAERLEAAARRQQTALTR